MDRSIVEGFQNLHVLPNSEAIDSLARDFAVALDESSPRLHRKLPHRCTDMSGCGLRHPTKKRRFKKRKSAPLLVGVIGTNQLSDALDSSCSDSAPPVSGGTLTRHDIMDTAAMSRLSDSDDLRLGQGSTRLPRITIAAAQLAESDSVTENWSPLRPQRRRRHLRRMAVDGPCEHRQRRAMHNVQNSLDSLEKSDMGYASGLRPMADSFNGKRKRGVKERSGNNSFDFDPGTDSSGRKCDCLTPDGIKMQESASSSVSSVDSDAEANSNEDAVDGDDEQSDFYAEAECPGAAGGSNDECRQVMDVAGTAIPWWEKQQIDIGDDDDDEELCCSHFDRASQFSRLLRGGFELMSPTSRSHFKTRFKLMSGRAFQSGRRRIKDRAQPPYSFTSFLQDRQLSGSTVIPVHCVPAAPWHQPCTGAPWYLQQPCGGAAAAVHWHRPCGPLGGSSVARNKADAVARCAGGGGGGGTSTDGGGGKRHRMMAKSEQMIDATASDYGGDLTESGTLTSRATGCVAEDADLGLGDNLGMPVPSASSSLPGPVRPLRRKVHSNPDAPIS